MTRVLLAVALGPVQDFIARARRMRDLWFGSHILSEMSRAVARHLTTEGWELVFPALPAGDPELEFCEGMWRAAAPPEAPKPPLAIVNKVLALGDDLDDAALDRLLTDARAAALAPWKRFAARAHQRGNALLRTNLPALHAPAAVIDDLLEFQVAWVRFDDAAEGAYGAARQRAEVLLGGRKNLRDFTAWEGLPLPKSTLDGFRETVLVDHGDDARRRTPRHPAWRVAKDFRVRNTEQLDGVGFVKRLGGEPDQFVPVARVALAPWIAAIEACLPSDPELTKAWVRLEAMCKAFEAQRIDGNAASWLVRGFAYDGDIFFEGQWPNLEFRHNPKSEAEEKTFGRDHVAPVLRALGSGTIPHPYVACLVADGDRMGKALAAIDGPSEHQGFSRALGEFARAARAIVESHRGVLIYSGGDDVLAVLPVTTSLRCANDLRLEFSRRMAPHFEHLPTVAPTLSVGVGIGHVLTPLGDLLDLGRAAEKHAKNGRNLPEPDSRNALAVVVDRRSGGAVSWRRSWNHTPLDAVQLPAEVFCAGEGSRGVAYEVEDLLRRFPKQGDATWAKRLRAQVEVILARKRDGGARGVTAASLGLSLVVGYTYEQQHAEIKDWLERASIARMIADAQIAVARIERKGTP